MKTQARPVFQAFGTVAHHATAGGSSASSTLLHYSLLGAAALLLLLLGAGAHHEGPTFTVLSSLVAAKQEVVPWGTLRKPPFHVAYLGQ